MNQISNYWLNQGNLCDLSKWSAATFNSFGLAFSLNQQYKLGASFLPAAYSMKLATDILCSGLEISQAITKNILFLARDVAWIGGSHYINKKYENFSKKDDKSKMVESYAEIQRRSIEALARPLKAVIKRIQSLGEVAKRNHGPTKKTREAIQRRIHSEIAVLKNRRKGILDEASTKLGPEPDDLSPKQPFKNSNGLLEQIFIKWGVWPVNFFFNTLPAYILFSEQHICPVYDAIKENDIERAEMLVVKGFDINRKNSKGETPLELMVRRNNVSAVKKLLELGANPNIHSTEKYPLLYHAIVSNPERLNKVISSIETRIKKFNKFLKYPQRNSLNFDMVSPFHFSRNGERNPEPKLVEMLIDAQVEINLNNTKISPLEAAIIANNLPAFKLLLKAGANIKQQNLYEESLFLSCLRYGFTEGLKHLIDKGKTEGVNLYSKKQGIAKLDPFFYAVNSNNTAAVDLFLKAGVNPNKVDELIDANALYLSTKGKLPAVTKILVDNGANVNFVDRFDATALIYSILASDEESAKILIDAGADLDHRLGTSKSIAMTADHKKKIKRFREYLPNLNQYAGYSPLGIAVTNNEKNIVRMLVEAGVDVNAPLKETDSEFSATALTHAIVEDQFEIVKVLLNSTKIDVEQSHLPSNLSPLFVAIFNKKTEMLKLLIESGVDLNFELVEPDTNKRSRDNDRQHFTPLGLSVYTGYLDGVKTLIEKGVDPNSITKKGFSLVYIAALKGRIDIANYLIEHGANASYVNPNGQNAADHLFLKEL